MGYSSLKPLVLTLISTLAAVAAYPGMSKGDLYQFGHREPPQALVNSFQDYNLVIRLAYLKFSKAPPHQELCNLSQPQHSLLLRSPLARSAGGLELCGQAVLANTDDADYQRLLRAVRNASERLDRQKRFDMPGFRPNPYYIRQMQTFGVLLADLRPSAVFDPYATDQAYWHLLTGPSP